MHFEKSDDIRIRYNNIHPCESTKGYIEAQINRIYEEAPYGAVITTTFSDRNGSVKGVMQIHSSASYFFAIAESNNLVEVVRNLSEQMRRRLKKWKHNRFKSPSPQMDPVA